MNIKKKRIIMILIIITILQIITRIYVGNKKQYYHMDEMYSYGLMNYNKLNIADNSDFLNTWHEKSYYEDYLSINSNEIFNLKPVYENQKNDVHPPFYYLLLRIFASFSIDHFSKWTGILLNMIIFAISNVFIYLISKKILKSPIYALVVCFVNGFTLIALDSSIYLRMYELGNLNILIITYLHIKIFNKENLKVKDVIPISICLLIGGLTHYYYFIYVATLYVLYTIQCIRKKQYQNLIRYNASIVITAILYLLIFPYSIAHIFLGYRGVKVGQSINLWEKFGKYLYILDNRIFNNLLILLILSVYLLSKNKRRRKVKSNNLVKLLTIPMAAYWLVVVIQSPYIETRYMIPIYSCIIIVAMYFIKQQLYQAHSNKITLFLCILLFLGILYSPKLTHSKLEYTYEKYNHIAQRVEEAKLPIIYVFNTQNNRILDDLYLFTKVDKSIIIDSQNEEKIKEILQENQKFVLICNEGVNEEIVKSYLNNELEYLQRMNACNIYIKR